MNFGSKNLYVPCVYKWSCGRHYSLTGTWGIDIEKLYPLRGKILHSKFTRLSQSFSPKTGCLQDTLMLIWPSLGVNWLHLGEYDEKLSTSGVWKEMQEQDVGEERRACKNLVNSGKPKSIANFFIFTTWHDMDLWCINSAHKIHI